ncbi:hypothetical protein JCM19037_4151 [Geomicrobium sp. JCM 19037]|uniref:hypothetical protein n=1 Tax=Geomicrobium sp. JCM 19037 TaxID=1460634 RepID=UPI00045F21AC|nr:hypothetical protein [Geomicrobium sp. JCM 19037]GAK05637.1 hypothetical protein JCM19037_4151 [Geomicrobium sp. JCM 19037]
MDWVVTDEFWKANVQSGEKLRKQFSKLAIKMKQEKQPVQKKAPADPRDIEIARNKWIAEGGDPREFKYDR